MIKATFLSTLSQAINHYLHLDAASLNRLKKLQDKVVTIEILPFHWVFQCQFSALGVEIHQEANLQAHTTISGTPLQLAGMILDKTNRRRFFAEDVKIKGEAEVGQQVTDLFDELHIDWEDHAARIIGDIPAYHLGKTWKAFKTWLSESDASLSEQIKEYIHEEANWQPSRDRLQDFFADIDTFSMDVDRLEMKIKQAKSGR